MTNHGFIAVMLIVSASGYVHAQSPAQRQTQAPQLTDTTRRTVARCPGGNGIHITATGGTLTDSTVGVNRVIGIGQSVDTTLVFNITRKTWTRTNLAAAISVGLADETRGGYAVCAGISALLPNVNLTLQGARGRVHFAASLKDFNDALRLGPR